MNDWERAPGKQHRSDFSVTRDASKKEEDSNKNSKIFQKKVKGEYLTLPKEHQIELKNFVINQVRK